MSTFRGQHINEVDVRGLIAQSREEQQQATPGRWTADVCPEMQIAPQEFPDYTVSVTDGERGIIAHVLAYHDRETTDRNARLIVAAANAVREAGYTVEELEAGAVKADHVGLSKLLAEKMRDLAECREALRNLVQWMQDSGQTHTPDGGHGKLKYKGTEYGVVTDARALLARIDQQG